MKGQRFFTEHLMPDMAASMRKKEENEKNSKIGNTKMTNAIKKLKLTIKLGRQ